MFAIDQDVAENYRALRAERGLSWEQLAEQVGAHGDTNLAAWCRQQADSEHPAPAPRGRRSAPKDQA